MDPWQTAQQIKHKLASAVWSSGPGTRVFGPRNVKVFSESPESSRMPTAFPFALVGIMNASHDDSTPQLIEQTYTIIVVVNVPGDPLGEYAILGGPVGDLRHSGNRGVAEVMRVARGAVIDLPGADGAKVHISASTSSSVENLGLGPHIAAMRFDLTAWCTSDLYYAAPQQIAHDGVQWIWKGAQCSDRFDFDEYRLIRKSGSSPSLYVTDGTEVYTGSTAEYTGAATGGNTYTLFAAYDARGRGVPDGYSDPVVGSYLTVI